MSENLEISKDCKVRLHMVGKTQDGQVFDSTRENNTPYEFNIGVDGLIYGFQKNIMGMKAGEKKVFTVTPDEGYGDIIQEAIQEIPLSSLPSIEDGLAVGMTLEGTSEGHPIYGTVREIREADNLAVVDFNHMLAGVTLEFDVEILTVTQNSANLA